ncbi:MAG TPA: NAD(P)-dependent oxidoreductase [Steroidobacteraceae bacterium]|nr:NAD(P)-dependent oxidoreductase [Steroidobacteraceae bacterium]
MHTGFIGLGAMGAPMARNLHRAGTLKAVWNRNAAKARELAHELGCVAAESPAALAREVDVILICVSADADVLEMIEALVPGLRRGQVVLDFSTVSADTARRAAARLAPLGVEFMDTPVSGGVEGARNATLAIMAGGDAATFATVQPVLQSLGRTLTHFGPHGSGQAAKATNQIMVAGVARAVAEAMAFAQSQALPLDQVIATLGGGAAASWFLTNRAPFMQRRSFPPGFRVRLHSKDLLICRAMAAARGVTLPVVEASLADYDRLIEGGWGDEDISAIFRLKAQLFEP